jgi:plasmid maintenance system antidote protein VapI
MNINDIKDIEARFDISADEADRIADAVDTEAEFVTAWENTDWWTDENNE